jgi:CheY-like chemotaxis protein
MTPPHPAFDHRLPKKGEGDNASPSAFPPGWEFDLLLSDVDLPDGSGLELMTVLSGGGARGIALIGYATEEDRRRSMEAGFAEHLTKPVTLGALEAAMCRVAGPVASERRVAALSP